MFLTARLSFPQTNFSPFQRPNLKCRPSCYATVPEWNRPISGVARVSAAHSPSGVARVSAAPRYFPLVPQIFSF